MTTTIDIDAITQAAIDHRKTASDALNRATRLYEQLAAAQNALRSLGQAYADLKTDNDELAAENARLRQQRDELREQVFAQKPVVKAAEAWAEAWEELKGDDTVPYVIAQPSAALHDAIEQHRLMDTALTSARAEHAEVTR